jgi:small subunit ribosomal protein S9
MADDATPPQDEQEQPQPEAVAEEPTEAAPADEATEAAAAPAEEAAAEDGAPEAAADEAAAPEAAADEAAAPEAAADEAAAPEDAADEAAAPEAAADDDEAPAAPREKPAIPGMDLEVDIVPEGVDPLARAEAEEEAAAAAAAEAEDAEQQPITTTIDLAADARYNATGKRKTAIARVILKPGTGAYMINGKTLDEFFPRPTLQRNIRQPLEAVGYEDRMDVVATMVGGGVSAQAGALRHGISRALLEADPNLRGELKRRGFLTRDARVKERKKAGLKKARKKPQFSKR